VKSQGERGKGLAALVTPGQAHRLPVHRWFLFPHSFSPGLVDWVIGRVGDEVGYIEDPFVGAGTTVRRAQELGISACGYDLLPLAVTVTQAKITRYDAGALQRRWHLLRPVVESLGRMAEEWDCAEMTAVPAIARWALSPAVLWLMTAVRGVIREWTSPHEEAFFTTALLRCLIGLSGARRDGGWLRRVGEPEGDPRRAVERLDAAVADMLADVASDVLRGRGGTWHVMPADARALPPPACPVDGIITSPPYLNRHDYTRIFALELVVGWGYNERDIIGLRRRLVRSHIEVGRPPAQARDLFPASLRQALRQVAEASRDGRVPRMVEAYFDDMALVLRQLRTRVRPGGFVAVVVGNARYSGVMVEVDEILAEMGERVGLRCREIITARVRNNSAQQMGAFGKLPARESVVIWRRE